MIEPLLLSCVPIRTFKQDNLLTNASGFFFHRGEKLFLVTSRHVLVDEPSEHFPDRIEIEIHTDPDNLAQASAFSILLYEGDQSLWREGVDAAGNVDVAVLEIDCGALHPDALYYSFSPDSLPASMESIGIGSRLLIVGFPLGFHDTLHHLPVARQGITASSFALRFQGNGYFLTDARTHRGMSGAPVVTSAPDSGNGELPWLLLGIHSARLDVGTRDVEVDEALGLNCAWFADILMTLTED